MAMKTTLTMALLCVFAACSQKPPERPATARKGGPAPQLVLNKLFNAPVKQLKSIEDLKGKVVVLEFWATWCEPCVENIPHLNALADKFSGKPVVFISVTDETETKVVEFMKTVPIKGWVAVEAGPGIFKSYKVFGRPQTVLIDKELKVAAFTFPSEVTEEKISALIADQAPSSPASTADNAEDPFPHTNALSGFYIAPAEGGKMVVDSKPNSYKATNMPLQFIIADLFDNAHEVEAAKGANPDFGRRFNISLHLPKERAADFKGFFAKSLESAVGIRIRKVSRLTQVYVLKPAVSGPKGFNSSRPGAEGRARREGSVLRAEASSPAPLADTLRHILGRPVVDETGLKDAYDYSFDLATRSRDPAVNNAALERQLGLRLEEASRMVEVVEVR